MTLEEAEKVATLIRRAREIDERCARLAKQDGEQSHFVTGLYLESQTAFDPTLSVDSARRIRSIMRVDYLATRAGLIAELQALGVSPLPEPPA